MDNRKNTVFPVIASLLEGLVVLNRTRVVVDCVSCSMGREFPKGKLIKQCIALLQIFSISCPKVSRPASNQLGEMSCAIHFCGFSAVVAALLSSFLTHLFVLPSTSQYPANQGRMLYASQHWGCSFSTRFFLARIFTQGYS